ncbi:MAG: UDP-N-acetylenolpyruvoylglucosamine reductase, partial [Gammaproteobacteria bacterium]|nr:UDP-N-acetylenolpyruvoylglucosamine reductase [Gammaproteobacteria bacterium]
EIKRLLAKRAETQPTKQANAGSVFKNPAQDYAARLIEECGLKGLTINDAQISPKHANFIVNKGAARAKDVEALINKIKAIVLEQCEVDLETEVRIIGEQAVGYE